MYRVLLQVSNSSMWIGGLNYFVNLCKSIDSLQMSDIGIIVLNGNVKLPRPLCDYQFLYWPPNNRSKSLLKYYYKIKSKVQRLSVSYNDFINILIDNDIKLFSHGHPLGKYSHVPSLCWIPDFQHRHLPYFFTKNEIKKRNHHHQYLADHSDAILFSSNAALDDFRRFHSASNSLTYVLHFIAIPLNHDSVQMDEVLEKYDIAEPFFHVPNQLWAHKNHGIIIDALSILRDRGKCPLVICTGLKEDYRNPDYFSGLSEKVKRYGLNERMRFLGLIDYNHVSLLMRRSIGLINPSLFEGWSTTVEEGKSLGKSILLSDIPVHREQAPGRGIYFPPHDAECLANLMLQLLKEYDDKNEEIFMKQASEVLPDRMRRFGNKYREIVEDVISRRYHN